MNRSELIAQAKQTDLVALLGHLGYQVKTVGHLHTIEEHDSVRIYDRKSWVRFSTGKGGSQIDWLEKMEGNSFEEAVQYLLEFQGYKMDERELNALYRRHYTNEMFEQYNNRKPEFRPRNIVNPAQQQKKEKKPFALPPRANSQKRLFGYLCTGRGLSYETVKKFFSAGIIYLSEQNNVVFVGRDPAGVARYASLRGTGNTGFRGDVESSNKLQYGFNLYRDKSDTVVVTEASIDLMSYYDLTKDENSSLLAMGMCSDNPLEKYLEDHSDITHIKFLLDSDGPGSKATKQLTEKYQSSEWSEKGYTVEDIRYPRMPVGCKDVNELLQYCNSHPEEMSLVRSYFLSGKVPELTVPVGKSQESMLIELMKSSLAEQNAMLMQLDQLSRSGEDVDLSEVDQIFGACNALYQLCAKAGLHPPLPGETWEAKERTVETLPSERMMKPPPAQSGVQKVTSHSPHRVRRM